LWALVAGNDGSQANALRPELRPAAQDDAIAAGLTGASGDQRRGQKNHAQARQSGCGRSMRVAGHDGSWLRGVVVDFVD
jgi:hypothetical protein